MRIEEIVEGYQGQDKPPGMLEAHFLKLEEIATEYLRGNISSKQARQKMREFGYDVHPDMKTAWKGSKLVVKDLKTERTFEILG